MSFLPYLNFGGNCREAFTRYQEIFGGELFVMGMSDMPGDDAIDSDRVAHAALSLPNGVLMASDAPPGAEFGRVQGMYVHYEASDPGDAKRVFDALAEGGEVEMPMGETFFAEAYGICRDRFGTPWMVNVPKPMDAGG